MGRSHFAVGAAAAFAGVRALRARRSSIPSRTSHVIGFVRDLGASVVPMMHLMRDIGGVQLPERVLRFADNGETAEVGKEKVKVGTIAAVPEGATQPTPEGR